MPGRRKQKLDLWETSFIKSSSDPLKKISNPISQRRWSGLWTTYCVVAAINAFVEEFNPSGLVVCCRLNEYRWLPERLKLNGAICLEPLSKDEVDNYLDRGGPELAALREAVNPASDLHDPVLEDLAQTPLMLSIMSWAYQGLRDGELATQKGDSTEERRKQIFRLYIEQMFLRKETTSPVFPKEKIIGWLSWLAGRMREDSQSVFLIEALQPSCLGTRAQLNRVAYKTALVLIFALIFGLVGWLTFGFIGGLIFAVVFAVAFGATPELSLWLISRFIGGSSGLLLGPVLLITLTEGFKSLVTLGKVHPNQWIKSLLKISSFVFLATWLTIGLIFGSILGLRAGFFTGLIVGLIGGGSAVFKHYTLRIILCSVGIMNEAGDDTANEDI